MQCANFKYPLGPKCHIPLHPVFNFEALRLPSSLLSDWLTRVLSGSFETWFLAKFGTTYNSKEIKSLRQWRKPNIKHESKISSLDIKSVGLYSIIGKE
ncbi:hypothetical protein ACHQM5_010348 [Ranunculus cassubicifolius]